MRKWHWMPWEATGGAVGLREREGKLLSREENGSLPPLIISPWAAKHVGVRGGAGEAVGKSSAHGD